MPVATMLAGTVHQPLDLALGEIASLDCQVYDAWCAFLGCRFHADKPCLRVSYCIGYTPFLHSRKGAARSASRSQCRMEAPGPVRGMRRRTSREANLICLAAEPLWNPPGRGIFYFEILVTAPLPK